MLRVRAQGGQGGGRKEREVSTTIDTDLYGAVEDAAAHLYVWALKDIPQDLRDALADAAGRETSVPGQRVLSTDPQERPRCRRREEPRLPGHRHRRLHLPGRRALSAPPGADLPGAEGGHRARDRRAPAALERRAHDHAREHRARTPATGCRSSTGSSSRAGTVSTSSAFRRGRAREHELPEDVRPRRRREGDQAVRAGVDRRARAASPARRGSSGSGIGGSADYAMYLAKEAITRPIGTRNADPVVAELERSCSGC
jgi:hypothetical protein